MDLKEVLVSENGQPAQAWVNWKGDIDVLISYISPADLRALKPKIMKPQFRGHQRSEDMVDDVALRNYYCRSVIKGVRGLTKDGAEFNPDETMLKRIWDGNHDFGAFVTEASMALQNFVEEKNG
jgi:hypothetical protein